MELVSEYLFAPYYSYSQLNIFLELTAVIFGLLSVWFSRKNSTLVYPTGLITTSIYVYLLFHWRLLGDMLINGYYFLMGIYGWYFWSKKENGITVNKISRVTKFESYVLWIWFFGSLVLVNVVGFHSVSCFQAICTAHCVKQGISIGLFDIIVCKNFFFKKFI